jgi:hypothetical protein
MPQEPTPPPTTVKEANKAYRQLKGQWFLDKIHGNPNSSSLVKAIKNKGLCIFSDSSYKNGLSTAACILTKEPQSFQLKIRSVIPRHPNIQDSY